MPLTLGVVHEPIPKRTQRACLHQLLCQPRWKPLSFQKLQSVWRASATHTLPPTTPRAHPCTVTARIAWCAATAATAATLGIAAGPRVATGSSAVVSLSHITKEPPAIEAHRSDRRSADPSTTTTTAATTTTSPVSSLIPTAAAAAAYAPAIITAAAAAAAAI